MNLNRLKSIHNEWTFLLPKLPIKKGIALLVIISQALEMLTLLLYRLKGNQEYPLWAKHGKKISMMNYSMRSV